MIKKFEEYNNIEITQQGGLECDNPDCDYADPSIKIEDYEEWINAPCPKCGANLLTQEDYDKTKSFMDALNLINSMSEDDVEGLVKKAFGGDPTSDDILDAVDKAKKVGISRKDSDPPDEWTFNVKKKK